MGARGSLLNILSLVTPRQEENIQPGLLVPRKNGQIILGSQSPTPNCYSPPPLPTPSGHIPNPQYQQQTSVFACCHGDGMHLSVTMATSQGFLKFS